MEWTAFHLPAGYDPSAGCRRSPVGHDHLPVLIIGWLTGMLFLVSGWSSRGRIHSAENTGRTHRWLWENKLRNWQGIWHPPDHPSRRSSRVDAPVPWLSQPIISCRSE